MEGLVDGFRGLDAVVGVEEASPVRADGDFDGGAGAGGELGGNERAVLDDARALEDEIINWQACGTPGV